jgi:hypothetical protein
MLGLLFLVVWTILFLWRKDVRKEMLGMSIFFGIAGLIVEAIYIQDWWRPLTITGTLIGIEDFLFGFVIGGIAAVIYEEVFKKKLKRTKKKNTEFKSKYFGLLLPIIFVVSIYVFNLNTFIASILAFGIPTIIIYITRKDLIKDSLLSGALVLGVSIIVYTILELITPGWVNAFWYFKNVPNIIILNVPIDDFIWYFLAGAFIGPFYEYWQNKKLVNKK